MLHIIWMQSATQQKKYLEYNHHKINKINNVQSFISAVYLALVVAVCDDVTQSNASSTVNDSLSIAVRSNPFKYA